MRPSGTNAAPQCGGVWKVSKLVSVGEPPARAMGGLSSLMFRLDSLNTRDGGKGTLPPRRRQICCDCGDNALVAKKRYAASFPASSRIGT